MTAPLRQSIIVMSFDSLKGLVINIFVYVIILVSVFNTGILVCVLRSLKISENFIFVKYGLSF